MKGPFVINDKSAEGMIAEAVARCRARVSPFELEETEKVAREIFEKTEAESLVMEGLASLLEKEMLARKTKASRAFERKGMWSSASPL